MMGAAMLFTSCSDDDDDDDHGHGHEHEEEVITTLRYTLTPAGFGEDVVLLYQDVDGDGGNPPFIQGGVLDANTVYSATLELLNESVDPAENVTEEIQAEDDEHQFFFIADAVDLTVAYMDQDDNGNPVGVQTTVTAGDVSNGGTLTVILRHQPDKDAAGVPDGDITNAGGETDIEVEFNVEIE